MPPVAAAAAAIGGAFTAAATAVAGTGFGGLFLTTTATGVGLTAAGQLVVGTALSAISRALLAPKGQGVVTGTKVKLEFGEDRPQSRILGTFCTAGDLVYHNSWGDPGDTPREYYVQVIELADFPASLSRVWINGEWVTLGSPVSGETERGRPVGGYWRDGHPRLYVKFHDGTQTAADPYLLAKFGSDSDHPWTSDMIGRGIPYVIVTAGMRGDLHRQKPEVRVELIANHYDRRRDSTAPGGSGAQRWNDWRTWRPSTNPIVMIDNVLRGLRDPITGAFVWGGQDVPDVGLPASVWIAAMNECDRDAASGQDQYRAGYEVRYDEEPAAVVEELLKACQGMIANVAGAWHVRAGPPGPPVYAFTDDDLIVTSPEEFRPFPGLNGAYNGVAARYPEPAEGWVTKDAPPRRNAAFLAADGGRINDANLTFAAVPYRKQVQRLMVSALKDERRFRRHAFALPPEARPLTPLDEVTWTSVSNGYESKDWSIPLIRDLPDGNCGIGLQERDPRDYDWDQVDDLPDDPTPPIRPPRPGQVANFAVEGAIIRDNEGRPRRSAIRLMWTIRKSVTGIRYRVRLASSGELLPADGVSPKPPTGTATGTLTARGQPVTARGQAVTYSRITNVDDGEFLISHGILPATDYAVQAIYEPVAGRNWSAWLPVTTPDVRIGERDIAAEVIDKVNQAKDAADEAAARSVEALGKANEVEGLVAGLSAEVLADLHELVAALGGLDTATVQEIRRIAVAGARKGWAKDPYFDEWEAGSPKWWTATGSTFMSRATNGFYPSALLAEVPSGATAAILVAEGANLPGADPSAEYVAASAMLRVIAGTVAGSRLRVEWRTTGTSTWTAGHAIGTTSFAGDLATWGFVVDPGRLQSREVVWRRPVPSADALRLVLEIKRLPAPAAVTMRVDYLDVRPLGEAELKGYLANGYADAAISTFAATITGPSGALAAMATTLRAEFGAADAAVTSSVVALTNEVEAIAGQVDSIQASFGGGNLVPNGSFEDGVHAAGVAPQWWASWPSSFSVIGRASSELPAVQAAPSRFIGRMAADDLLRVARAHGPVPVKPGAVLSAKLRAAGSGSGINAQVGIQITLLGADGETQVAAPLRSTMAVTSGEWATLALPTFTIPAGVSYFETWVLKRAGAAATPIYFTGVECRFVDDVALARAETAIATAATATAAVASMQTTISAEFGSWNAFVQQTASAVALADMAASTFVFRAVAGGGSAGVRLVAWDDETGAGGAVLLDAAHVIAPGTFSTGELVVTDLGYNMVPDNQLQSARAWGNAASPNSPWSLIKATGHANADSLGELRYTDVAGASTNALASSARFAVRPGQRLEVTAQVARLGSTGRMVAGALVRFFTKQGDTVGQSPVGSVDTSDGGLNSMRNRITVPAGAWQADFIFRVIQPENSANVRFFAPSVINNADASVLITPDGAFFGQLAAEQAWIKRAMIANAEIDTLRIAGGSVTIPAFAQRASTFTAANNTNWQDIVSFTMPMPHAGLLMASSTTSYEPQNNSGGTIASFTSNWRLLVDGAVVYEHTESGLRGTVAMTGARAVGAGNRQVRVQFQRATTNVLPRSLHTSAFAIGAMR